MATQSPGAPSSGPAKPLAAAAARPPYVAIPSITNPKLAEIPSVEQFLVLADGEKVVKSYRIRVRRPKFPKLWFLLLLVLVSISTLVASAMYYNDREVHRSSPGPYDYYEGMKATEPSYDYDSEKGSYKKSNSPAEDFPSLPPSFDDGEKRESPFDDGDKFERPNDDFKSFHRPGRARLPLEVTLVQDSFDSFEEFDDSESRSRSSPLLAFVAIILLVLLPVALFIGCFLLFRKRGHTFLYVTNLRLIIVELDQGILGRSQTILNYTLANVSGFTLHAQRGLRKLLNLILLREKRTFYLSVITKTLAQFELGAINFRGSKFDPGQDAVALCAELDAVVLGIKTGSLPR